MPIKRANAAAADSDHKAEKKRKPDQKQNDDERQKADQKKRGDRKQNLDEKQNLGDGKQNGDGQKKGAAFWRYFPRAIGDPRGAFLALRPRCAAAKKQVVLYGKKFDEPRRTTYFSIDGHKYRYSGLTHDSQGWPEAIQSLMFRTYELTGECYDAALTNLYSDGRDYISAHFDNDALGAPVASWSFGQTRTFVIRDKKTNYVVHTQDLQSGSLFIMERGCQERFLHELPKRSPNKCPGERINVTFRRHSQDVCDTMAALFAALGSQSQPWLPAIAQLLFWRPLSTRS